MDDLILVGALSITALYAAGVLVIGSAVVLVLAIAGSVTSGDPAGAAVLAALVLAVLAGYSGTGLWLQRSGRL